MHRLILFVLSTTLLSGCLTVPSVIDRQPRPPIPASLLERCPDLTPLEGNTMGHLAAKLVEVSGLYYQCQARHSGLSDATSQEKENDG